MLLKNILHVGILQMRFSLCLKRNEIINKIPFWILKQIILHRSSKVSFIHFIGYKLVWSVFLCSKMHLFQNKMNEQIKVLSIAAYYFFPSLRQFSNSISKKWLVFEGDPILEPIFDFCERSEPVTCCIVSSEQPVIRRSNVWRIWRVR